MASIKFKFLNGRDFDFVLFEGTALPMDALKRAIAEKRGLVSGVDLVVMDTELRGEWCCLGAEDTVSPGLRPGWLVLQRTGARRGQRGANTGHLPVFFALH